MVATTDALVAELSLRMDAYRQGINEAVALNQKLRQSVEQDLGAAERSTEQSGQRQSSSRQKRSAEEIAAAKAEAAAARQAARDKAAAEKEVQKAVEARAKADAKASADAIAAAEREAAARAQLAAVIDRTVQREEQRRQALASRSSSLGGSSPREATMLAPHTGAFTPKAPNEDAKEVNHLLADQADIQARLTVATGAEKEELRAQATELRLISNYRRAGLSDTEAAIRAEEVLAGLEARRAEAARLPGSTNLNGFGRFAEGAGLGRTGGNSAALAGVVTASAVGAVAVVAKQGLDYAKDLKETSDQLGITTRDLQVYQAAAANAGVTTDQLRQSFAQVNDSLGKAQEGSEQQGKLFAALNVDVGNARDGYKNLSDILPTLADRLSEIPDKARRLAVETALGGEQLAKLDPVLSGGAASIETFAAAYERAGGIMANSEIQHADKTALKIQLLNDQLQRNLASTVAQNAEAINSLADAFFRAANGAVSFFNAQRLNQNKAILENRDAAGLVGLVTGKGGAQTQDDAFQDSMGFAAGRSYLLDRNTAQLNALHAADHGGSKDAPGFVVPDDPQARYQLHQQLLAQRARIVAAQRADAAANNPTPTPAQAGSVNSAALENLFAPKGRKGKSAEQLDAEQQQRDKQYADQLDQLQDAALRAQEEMTGDISQRADIEKKLLDEDLARRIKDIQAREKENVDRGANAGQEAARAKTLIRAAQNEHDQQAAANEQNKQAELARAATTHQETLLTIQGETLQSQLALAQTAKERLAIEQKLLNNEKQQERVRLQGIIAAAKPGDPAITDAQAQLNTLDQRYADRGKVIAQQNEGPGRSYYDTLPTTTNKLNEAFQNAAVHGLQSVEDRLTSMTANFLHLHGLAGQFLQDLIKIGIQRELLAPIANALFPSSGAGGTAAPSGIGGLISTIGRALGIGGGGGTIAADNITGLGSTVDSLPDVLPGFATGGGGTIGGRGGVDQNLLSINGKGVARVSAGEQLAIIPHNFSAAQGVQTPGRGGDVHLHFAIDARNSVNPDDFENRVLGKAGQIAASLDVQNARSIRQSTPSTLAAYQKRGTVR